MAAGAPRATQARIAALVEPLVADAGYDLEEVAVWQAGRRTVVRVVVDADGGISLDDIADLSRAVSDALDAADTADGGPGGGFVSRSPYTLEVTSPGVDRPLTEPRHWRRNVGRLVSVRVDDETLTGRIRSADDAGVVLDLDSGRREVPYARLGAGTVQVEFSRADPWPAGAPAAGTGGDPT